MTSVISTAILRTQTDERLVALSRTGHQRAFEAIAERYRAELTRSLRRLLPSGSVEDALQQTHLQAWKALAGGTEVRELRGWLHRIARNAAIAVASRGYDYDELQDALLVAPGPEDDLERRDAVRRTLRGIAELPDRQREALLAVAVGGRSHAEVALELGITDTAARQLVRRARVSLLAVASLATPPQLVRWAARAGHGALAGKAAAGTGLGGGLVASATKVGAVAVTVGGVAAVGIGPIHHALAPPAPPTPAAHHHRHVRTSASGDLTAAVTPARRRRPAAPAAPPAAAPTTAAALSPATVHRVRRVRVQAIGKLTSPTSSAVPTSSPAPSSTSVAPTTTPAAAPAPAVTPAAFIAAMVAWWQAQHAATTASAAGGGSTTTTSGGQAGSSSTSTSCGAAGAPADGASVSSTQYDRQAAPSWPGAEAHASACASSAH